MRITPVVALIVPTLLAACASALESPFTVFADPGVLQLSAVSTQRLAVKTREQTHRAEMCLRRSS
jgi:hypothetical protein